MLAPKALTASYAVAGQLTEADFAAAAKAGFATIVNFRPDDEAAGQLPTAAARQAALNAGIAYVHLPANKLSLFSETLVAHTADVIATARGPILAYCASGQRAAILWGAACERTQPVDDVLATLMSAGFELSFLRDDLDAQADRARWDVAPAQPANEPSLAAA